MRACRLIDHPTPRANGRCNIAIIGGFRLPHVLLWSEIDVRDRGP
jgi:hypothetical protein